MPLGWRVRALAAAAVVPALLAVVSFPRLERFLTAAARMRRGSAPDDQFAADWVDDTLGKLPGPWQRNCLRRASVLYYLLQSSGRAVELCIGVRKDERGVLLAHAWLVRDGAIYLEPTRNRDVAWDFREIARFPHAG